MTWDPLPLHQIMFGFSALALLFFIVWIVGGPEGDD